MAHRCDWREFCRPLVVLTGPGRHGRRQRSQVCERIVWVMGVIPLFIQSFKVRSTCHHRTSFTPSAVYIERSGSQLTLCASFMPRDYDYLDGGNHVRRGVASLH
jgi:hypothetical protein